MIDENFVSSAIRIRREFLSIESDMSKYKRKATDVVKNLNYLIKEIQSIQEKAQKREIASAEEVLTQLTKVLDEVESEGKKLEVAMKPLNVKMEKLALEEQELWRNIKQKHSDIKEEDIVDYVKDRLIKENLS